MSTSIWVIQRLAKRHVKALFDLAWSTTFVREACEQLQHKICVDSLVNSYWTINVNDTCTMGQPKARKAKLSARCKMQVCKHVATRFNLLNLIWMERGGGRKGGGLIIEQQQ